MRKKRLPKYTLLMVEGDTECIFYERLKTHKFRGAPSKTINLEGNWNINHKVLDEFQNYSSANPGRMLRIFIAIDRESRHGLAQVDIGLIKRELATCPCIKSSDIVLFEAVQDIESWFFHDIDGIFNFLRMPSIHRLPNKYKPVEKLNNRDLSKLFGIANKTYRKGRASKNFIDALNLDIICNNSSALKKLCTEMQKTVRTSSG